MGRCGAKLKYPPGSEARARMAALYRGGMTVPEVAAAVGISVVTVRRYLLADGVPMRPPGLPVGAARAWHPETITKRARAAELRAAGKTMQEIGDELGVSRERVRQWLDTDRVGSTVWYTCVQCGARFGSVNARNRGRPIRFCSNRCWQRHRDATDPDLPARQKRLAARRAAALVRRRRVVDLWVDGYSLKAIADDVGTTRGMVSQILARCRDEPEFRDRLAAVGDRRRKTK